MSNGKFGATVFLVFILMIIYSVFLHWEFSRINHTLERYEGLPAIIGDSTGDFDTSQPEGKIVLDVERFKKIEAAKRAWRDYALKMHDSRRLPPRVTCADED